MPSRRISDALRLGHRDSLRHYQMATQERPLWPIDWRYLWFVVKHLAWYHDSMQLRGTVGACSLWWAFELLTVHDLFQRPAYALMGFLSQWFWAIGFGLHGLLAWWRLIERRERIKVAVGVNLWGVVVWSGHVLCVNLAVGQFAATTILECIVILLMVFATINTGWNESRGTE